MSCQRKSSNVNYSLNDIRKTLYLPLVTEKFTFATDLADPVWQKAAEIDDFVRFGDSSNPPAERKTQAFLFRTLEELVIGWRFYGEKADRLYPQEGQTSPWHGDLAELHFGAMDPDPWHLQLGVGLTGLAFDSSGAYNFDIHAFENDEFWGAEVRIPLANFLISEGGIGFDICRCDMKTGKFYCWSPLAIRFHEIEDFGELLLLDYNTCAMTRSGVMPAETLDRKSFENLRNSWEIKAEKVIHGPYLSCIESTSVCINWETAGRLPAYLEYRKKDSGEAFKKINCSQAHGIMASENCHFVKLEGLLPDTEYEYTLHTLLPVRNMPQQAGKARYFKTAPAGESEFSFFAVTDIHSDANFLTRALETVPAQSSLFHLLLGDNLSHASGRESLSKGILDPITSVNLKKETDIPLVFVRGNHEQLGVYANEYFTLMRHYSGKSYYSFSCGEAFFIILDSGDDKADGPGRLLFSNNQLLAEEEEFLRKTVQSDAYKNAKYRLVFIHIPPFVQSNVQMKLANILAEAENQPSVMLSGHWHSYIRIDKDSSKCHENTAEAAAKKLAEVVPLPFVRVAAATEQCFNCRITPDALKLDILRVAPDGGTILCDSVEILP